MKQKKGKSDSILPKLLFFFMAFIPFQLFGQTMTITGKVVDASNLSLPGVHVQVEGTSTGTMTDREGNYQISAQKATVLVFSFIGMQTQRITIDDQEQINVSMQDEILEEIIVVGYGTKPKGAITGSIVKVSEAQFQSKSITNAMDALQGVVAGVTITRSSGQPGSEGHALSIRGNSSINGNKPMVLIDGIPGDMNLLNPNDIADVTILKDASAAIYGARAADGVILITTKNGKLGKPTVSYSYNFGIKQPQFLKKMANTSQLAQMYDEGMTNIGQTGLSQEVFDRIDQQHEPDPNGGWMKYLENFPGFYTSNDWYDIVYGNTQQQIHSLNISGGTENTSYLFSVGYENNNGAFDYGTNYSNRYNIRMNYDFRLFNRVKIETRTTFDNSKTVEPSKLGEVLNLLSRRWSYLPIYNPQGEFYKYQGYANPVLLLTQGGESISKYSKFRTNLKAEMEIIEGLKMVGQASVDLSFWHKTSTNPTFNSYDWNGSVNSIDNNPNWAGYENSQDHFNTYIGYLDYNKTINLHHFNLMAGASYEQFDTEYQGVWGTNFSTNQLFTLNLADKTRLEYTDDFNGTASDNAMRSVFGRASYNFEKKLFVDLTFRKDASSKFAPEKRWSDLYPSIAAAWTITEHDFMNSLSFIDNLKLRLSWGQAGNQEINFGNYDYIPLLYTWGNYPLGSPNVGLQGAESAIASSDRSWETIQTSNIGLDLAFLNSRLTGSIDGFIKKNDNMLVGISVPATFGGTPPTGNYGKLKTTGWEVSLKWKDNIGNLQYSVSALLSDNKNELLALESSDSYGEGINWTREGYSLQSIFGYEFDGIIQNQQQLDAYKQLEGVPSNLAIGDAMYKDLDGDGKITAFGDPTLGTNGDMKYLGNLLPRYSYASNIQVIYKNFDLNIFLQGVGKRNTIRNGDFGQPFYWVWHQPMEYFYGKSWTPENTDAQYPRLIPGGVGYDNLRDWNWRTSSMRIINVGYLRLKDVTIGYNLPQNIANKIKASNLRVYVSGKDLFTFSKGSWEGSFDPEEEKYGSWLSENTYPFYRVFSLGLDVKF